MTITDEQIKASDVPPVYVPFENPKVNDDLMHAFMLAIVNTPGLTGPVLLDSLRALVAHLSLGKRQITDVSGEHWSDADD